MKKNILTLLMSLIIFVGASNVSVMAENNNEEYSTTYFVGDSIDVEELRQELERKENEKISHLRNLYSVQLEYVRTEYKWTGKKIAGNQPARGVNFGSNGGSFGYSDGNSYSRGSMSFGAGLGPFSFSIGVGSRVNAGVTGYNVYAEPNTFVRLKVSKEIKVVIYKRTKVYHINGYKEAYGYTAGSPIVNRISLYAE